MKLLWWLCVIVAAVVVDQLVVVVVVKVVDVDISVTCVTDDPLCYKYLTR